ncbi:MAG TPA: PQQ-binding-like beta-propeller repeat protein [Streptosporangiaceae bacterium]|nr:PQQ-binding-like beta-propeller repeat protein [Streptosporangiaceae bacterium]
MRQPARSARKATGPRRLARRLRRTVRARVRTARIGWPVKLGTARRSPWLRRGVLAAALLAVAFVPYPIASQGAPANAAASACKRSHVGCHAASANMLRWTETQLPGSWDVLPGLAGTVPDNGQAYASAGNGIVALGADMSVAAYSAASGNLLWQDPLAGFPAGAQIVSVRTWPGEVTVGVSYQGQRTEVVFTSAGTLTGQYPAAPSGGAVAGSAAYTVIVGRTAVICYANGTGHIRWQHPTGDQAQSWQLDGQTLYVTESAGGSLGSAPVTALRRIDTVTGVQQQVVPPDSGALEGTASFDGTLTAAFDGVVLFTGASGVTAYDGSYGQRLWSVPGAVPETTDPQQGRLYLTRGSTLLAVSPLTGKIRATAPSAGLYAVRSGVALGIDPGAGGDAWGYVISEQRSTMTASGFEYPHYFVDLSGVGGSADPGSDLVVIAACAQVGPAATAAPSATSSGTPSPPASPSSATASPSATASASSPPPAPQPCVRPELLGLSLLPSLSCRTTFASSSAVLASAAWRPSRA